MDFNKLLTLAQTNKHESQSEASVKRYSTVFAPAKKEPKSNVPSISIEKFLAKQDMEKKKKEIQDRKKKEQLLALRVKNTKSNKAAKLMASRTKDNDFSRIKLTEDEVEEKKKREVEIMRLQLNDKKDRMKARIELEEKEKLLPHKRKRKSKTQASDDRNQAEGEERDMNYVSEKNRGLNSTSSKSQMKPRPPPKPSVDQSLSYDALLKVAATKQYQPVEIKVVKKDDNERPMTKKAKRLLLDEQNRAIRKQQLKNNPSAASKDNTASKLLPSDSSTKKIQQSFNKKQIQSSSNQSKVKDDSRQCSNQPFVVRVQKDVRADNESKNNVISNSSTSLEPLQTKKVAQHDKGSNYGIKSEKAPEKYPENRMDFGKREVSVSDELMAKLEEQITKKLEKQFEEKLRALSAVGSNSRSVHEGSVSATKCSAQSKLPQNLIHTQKPKRPFDTVNKSPNINTPSRSSEVCDKPVKKPEKKFHINPYMQPRRILLEKTSSSKRIIEDEDDFIDDDDENYSKHIKKLFRYDRTKYRDDDIDDVEEASFATVMKEERQSTVQGYKDDIEDMQKEKAFKKKLKQKKLKNS